MERFHKVSAMVLETLGFKKVATGQDFRDNVHKVY